MVVVSGKQIVPTTFTNITILSAGTIWNDICSNNMDKYFYPIKRKVARIRDGGGNMTAVEEGRRLS